MDDALEVVVVVLEGEGELPLLELDGEVELGLEGGDHLVELLGAGVLLGGLVGEAGVELVELGGDGLED